MKKIILIATISFVAALLAVSCSKDATDFGREGEAAVRFSFSMSPTRAAQAVDPDSYPGNACKIRVYKYENVGGEVTKGLIRRYDSFAEMPEQLWLLEGRYSISVELGSRAAASFDEPSYAGETDFTVAGGASQRVEVACKLVNTIVEVVYDATIAQIFTGGYATTVAIADAYDQSAVDKGSVLSLTYPESRRGYFILPADAKAFSWRFTGEGEKEGEPLALDKTGTKSISTTPGTLYRLNLKYSKDQGGFLDFTIEVDENVTEYEDRVTFSPDPQIAGDGFEIAERQQVTDGLSYKISAVEPLVSLTIEADGQTFTPAIAAGAASTDGIVVDRTAPTELTLTLQSEFFAQFPGGDHTLKIAVTDDSGAEGEKESQVRTQGAYELVSTDCWNAKGAIRAYVFQTAVSDVQIRYREVGTSSWKAAPAASNGDGTYSAEVSDIHADTRYEYQLLLGGKPVNAAASTTIGNGPQILNAGFEEWTDGTPLLPYVSEQYWDSGNHGSATMKKNVTTYIVDGLRPGTTGSKAAMLNSQFVGLGSIGKFAAGNLFVGTYAGTNGTNGVIGFGKPFAFTYRPRQLKFWYKGTVGTVDHAGGSVNKGDSDVAQLYICLCKMDGPHIVDTRDSGTFFNPAGKTVSYCTGAIDKNSTNDKTDGHIIAYHEWTNTQSMGEWTQITIDLIYNDEYEGEVPNYLMLTASASKYGDYFAGSTESVMYLDDIELVY